MSADALVSNYSHPDSEEETTLLSTLVNEKQADLGKLIKKKTAGNRETAHLVKCLPSTQKDLCPIFKIHMGASQAGRHAPVVSVLGRWKQDEPGVCRQALDQ